MQSSVFMHIVYTCICFPEQLNNNKYDVNGDCGTFVGGACFIFFPPPSFSIDEREEEVRGYIGNLQVTKLTGI